MRPFEIAIREAKPWAVMSAYNRVNGTYACENDYTLKKMLKGEWGFDGLVMSDWFGTYDADVVKGGLDLEMPGPPRWMGEAALEAARKERSAGRRSTTKCGACCEPFFGQECLRTPHHAGAGS